MTRTHTFYAENLVPALLAEGIPDEQILELEGWQTNEPGYYWTDPRDGRSFGYDGTAYGHLNHHTASSGYTPYVKNSNGQTKCNVWGGLLRGDRLYQEGGGIPTLAIASAGPADYSAGSGVRALLSDYLIPGIVFDGRQYQSDDSPKWYGNRSLWNTEWVLDGIGGQLDPDVWDLLIAYNAALCRLHDADDSWLAGHLQFTSRKIDLRDGRYPDGATTLAAIHEQTAARLNQTPEEALGMPYEQFKNLVISLFAGRPDKFHGDPAYFYTKSGEEHAFEGFPNGGIYDVPDSPDWPNFWDSFVDSISLTT